MRGKGNTCQCARDFKIYISQTVQIHKTKSDYPQIFTALPLAVQTILPDILMVVVKEVEVEMEVVVIQ